MVDEHLAAAGVSSLKGGEESLSQVDRITELESQVALLQVRNEEVEEDRQTILASIHEAIIIRSRINSFYVTISCPPPPL